MVTTDQVRAELLAWAPEGVEAGKPVWLGLQLAHQPDWHTYWKNSGDSGLPTMLEWQLPDGITAGDIAWPTPKKIPIGTLANYGYEHTVLLPVPLTVAPGFNAQQLDITLKATAALVAQGLNVTLDLAGDGPEQAALQQLIVELGLEQRVRFLGFLGNQELLSRLPDY